MSLAWPNCMPLASAKLCSNCDYISDARGETCPACGAFANWLPLARLLAADLSNVQIAVCPVCDMPVGECRHSQTKGAAA